MNAKRRVERVDAALRRQRAANGRTVIRYEGGPCWHDGRIVEPLENDLVIDIVYEAKPGTTNLKRLTWGDDNLITSDADA